MKSSKVPYFFLGLATVLALSALGLLLRRPGVATQPEPSKPSATRSMRAPTIGGASRDEESAEPVTPPADSKLGGGGVMASDPADLVHRIAKAFEAGDLAALEQVIGKDVLDPTTAERLKAWGGKGVRIRQDAGVREVGELALNARTRWVLELDGQEPGRDRIFLDLRRNGQKWSVEKIILPPAPGEPVANAGLVDALDVADAFLQAVLKQDFQRARKYLDVATVSDAKIAGLCILFEQGGYRLRKSKPLRTMFQRPEVVGFLAHVETADGSQNAQFSLTLKPAPAPTNWRVSEVNLDQLLTDYTRRAARGDLYDSPLVKNPSGGDTLALYFDFDADSMNARTRRQLEIVSLILRADVGKKLTLSGHTDALGSESYNQNLSERRAEVVRDFLITAGVASSQIVTIAKGASQPRRPNVTESGNDNPDGRRANRRTEIYLDF